MHTRSRQALIITSIICVASSPAFAELDWSFGTPYQPRQTLNIQGGHGYEDDYDVLLPILGTRDKLFFVNGEGATAHYYGGGDIGVGYRQLALDDEYVLGAYSFFGRYLTNFGNYFSQTTVGLEALGTVWDARVNGYIPVSSKRKTISTGIAPNGFFFTGHKLHAIRDDLNEVIEGGVDAEVGRAIPGIPGLRGYIGYYHYGFTHHEDIKANGGEVRGEYRINSHMTFTASDSYDRIRGNQFVLGMRFTLGAPEMEAYPSTAEKRMTDYIIRRRGVLTTRHNKFSPWISPENFYFVSNTGFPGMRRTLSAGNGTFESPYLTVGPAELAASTDGNTFPNYVYIFNGNGSSYTLNGALQVGNNQIFMGSGTNLIYRGVNVLSASGAPTLVGGLLSGNQDVFSSFNLSGTATGLGTAISVLNVSNVAIANVNISSYTGGNGGTGAMGTAGMDATSTPATAGGAGGAGGAGISAYGINIVNSSNVVVNNVNITNLTGGIGGAGGTGGTGGDGNNFSGVAEAQSGMGGAGGIGGIGGDAAGIHVANSKNVAISQASVSGLTAGNGGAGGLGGTGGVLNLPFTGGYSGNGGIGGNGGSGGSAVGIQFANTTNVAVQSVALNGTFTGGTGGLGGTGGTGGLGAGVPSGNGSSGGNGGSGGNALGIQFANTANAAAQSVTLTGTFTGGTGGLGGTGGTGGAGSNNLISGNGGNGGTGGNGGNAFGLQALNTNLAGLNILFEQLLGAGTGAAGGAGGAAGAASGGSNTGNAGTAGGSGTNGITADANP